MAISIGLLVYRAVTYPQERWRRFWDYRSQRLRSEDEITKTYHPDLRKGLLFCTSMVAWILCMNIIVGIWAASTHSASDGLTVTLFQGECVTASTANFWIHLLINILASTLFTASSFVMQRLAAPTREDLDRAHKNNRSLKIGSLAITNFALLSRKRLAIFSLLWTTSLPIHLMYNSLIEYTTSNAELANYVLLSGSQDLPELGINATMLKAAPRDRHGIQNATDISWLTKWLVTQQPLLERLSPMDCINVYSLGTNVEYGDVIVIADFGSDFDYVTTLKSPADSLSYSDPETAPWNWICSDAIPCEPRSFLINGTWTINSAKVDHCLVRKLPQQCELNMSLSIMIAVCLCNIGKLCAMVLTISVSMGQPLVTIGDAIASFLDRKDDVTEDRSIADKDCFPSFWNYSDGLGKASVRERSSRRRLILREMRAAWFWANFFGFVLLMLTLWFFVWTYIQTRKAYQYQEFSFSFSTIWNVGVGNLPALYSYTQQDVMTYRGSSGATSYINGAVLANLPQLALSFLYLFYNNIFSRIFMALEFRSFAMRRQGLRVSHPQKQTKQRSTYFLQFPLKWSLIMIAYFVVLHTFLSESLFLRRINEIWPQSFYDPDDVGKALRSQIGFSPLALFFLLILLSFLFLFSFAVGFVRRDWVLPCLNGESRSISAACHPPAGTKNAHIAAVRWGVTGMSADGIGHCSFSVLPVRPPELGEKFL